MGLYASGAADREPNSAPSRIALGRLNVGSVPRSRQHSLQPIWLALRVALRGDPASDNAPSIHRSALSLHRAAEAAARPSVAIQQPREGSTVPRVGLSKPRTDHPRT
jgi:hypothetical protein